MTLMRCIESLLTRDIMEYPERRKLEDVPSVKSDPAKGNFSRSSALYKTSDPTAEIRYTTDPSQTGKETPMLRRHGVRPHLWLCLLLGSFLTLNPLGLRAAEPPNPPEGLIASSPSTSMPVFELPDANGETVRAAVLQGKVVVVRFWATW
jgi:hypothetical protein